MWKIDQILAVFAPFTCLNCGQEGNLLCHQCGFNALPPPPRRCYHCRQPCARAVCPVCRPNTLASVQVATSYGGLSVQLVARLKFARTQAAAPLIARIMDRNLSATPVDTIVVHIPTSSRRVRERGYDQAQLIAREFARCRRLPCKALLRRQGHARQLGASRDQRRQQLQAAYYCPRPDKVKNQHLILVDDVLTTGATIEAAATVLRRAGARTVSAVLFAQKL